jgi:hypothetical protein
MKLKKTAILLLIYFFYACANNNYASLKTYDAAILETYGAYLDCRADMNILAQKVQIKRIIKKEMRNETIVISTMDSCTLNNRNCPYEVYTIYDSQQDTVKFVTIDDSAENSSIFKNSKGLALFQKLIQNHTDLHTDLIRILQNKKYSCQLLCNFTR